MSVEILDAIPLWGLFLAGAAIVSIALEGGYLLGRWRRAHGSEEKDAPVGAMVGAILGLLAFILAFTFSMAASRFDARRQVVLEEANAIGTTYLRARMLPEPQRTEVAKLLREYVDVRLSPIQDGRVTITEVIARSEALHEQLWLQATIAAEKSPTPITAIFVQSLNDVIDVHAKRVLAGLRSRIPMSIWCGLFTLAFIGMASMGYQAGLSATRRSPASVLLILAFAGVLLLIADLDRGQEGFLRVSQAPMTDLQRSMQPAQQ
jgi:hypothetical protein